MLETLSRVEWHLANWARWTRAYSPKLELPGRAVGLSSSSSKDFDEMCEDADNYAAQVTEAAIMDLPPAQAAAVNRKWLDAVYNFPRDNYAEMYALALKFLSKKLDAQGLV